MTDIILALVILTLVGGAVRYIYKSHKKGVKCIGCPAGCSCSYKNREGGCCSEKH
ncbi:MAG: FeoB-associated Cys-rich membrane protein [Phascolarctobacterium sp.]|nr:FeoB-associated Cys-rich membrane protein [Phascolarctobacterium sp.]